MRRTDLLETLIPRIESDYEFKRSSDGRYFRYGICPSCSKRELFADALQPWTLKCGRENRCGEVFDIKDLYYSEFSELNKRYQPTEADPKATARAYLELIRGLDATRWDAHFDQGSYYNPNADKGTATVRFHIDRSAGTFNERFIETVQVTGEDGTVKTRKNRNKGEFKGQWWCPEPIQPGDEVHLVEGVLDAMSLIENGIKAVAIFSSSNFPKQAIELHLHKGVKWIWALDNDTAGKSYMRKHMAKLEAMAEEESQAVMLPPSGRKKQDWNDLHNAKEFAPRAAQGSASTTNKLTRRHLEEYRYHGSLFTAKSQSEKALAIYNRRSQNQFSFEFKNRTYWFQLDLDKYNKVVSELGLDQDEKLSAEDREEAIASSNTVRQICNCAIEFLYYQRNELTDESWYYARIDFPTKAPSAKNTFKAGHISSHGKFKERLLDMAQGAVWEGSAKQLDHIAKTQLEGIKVVQTIDYIGYVKKWGCYVYNNVAIKDGRRYEINDEDYFELPGNQSAKSLLKPEDLRLATDASNYQKDWIQVVWRAFGPQGVITAAGWFGSLFVEQIRAEQESFPFLEVIGEPGAGKTTLIEFLWRLFGRDEEGIDPNKGTMPGLYRTLAQYSGMPTVFIEADRQEDSHSKRFDWEETKPYYNGRGMRVKGVRNGGQDTISPPFRGSLVIAQNEPVYASDAVLERIIQLRFTKAGHTAETTAATRELNKLRVEDVSWFLSHALKHEAEVVKHVVKRVPEIIDNLLADGRLKHARIAKNHAQFAALIESLGEITGLDEKQIAATKSEISSMAMLRQAQVGADSEVVAQFWDIYEFLKLNVANKLNRSSTAGTIAINLNQFVGAAKEAGQVLPEMSILKRQLKNSRSRPFIKCHTIWDRERDASLRCWMFKATESES